MEKLRHGSLFSGIGGFDLAAEWMGWDNVFHCEWNEFGQKVLKHYWPQAESFSDITKTDFTKYYGTVDIITGGFPCQPYSSAGKRKGKEDERHLWPEMCRAIREVSPRFVVGENVRGLTNWNGGMVFEEVCAELESYGYQVAPVIIPACGVDAPHRRERIWFVAYAKSAGARQNIGGIRSQFERCDKRTQNELFATNANGTDPGDYDRANDRETEKVRRENESNVSRELSSYGNASNANGSPTKYTIQTRRNLPTSEISNGDATNSNSTNNKTRTLGQVLGKPNRKKANGYSYVECPNQWQNFPTESPICGRNDGLPSELDGITFSKWRNESIKAYGNAIVPQVAFQIFKALEKSLYLPR